jgi:hypothetical protein
VVTSVTDATSRLSSRVRASSSFIAIFISDSPRKLFPKSSRSKSTFRAEGNGGNFALVRLKTRLIERLTLEFAPCLYRYLVRVARRCRSWMRVLMNISFSAKLGMDGDDRWMSTRAINPRSLDSSDSMASYKSLTEIVAYMLYGRNGGFYKT